MTRPPKQRADLLLVATGLAESRARAQALILAGKVFTDGKRVEKAGDLLADGAPLDVRGQDHPWVSRGGLKLAHALGHFGLKPEGRVCLDLGASTGGFTDVLLHHGAAKIYAVDVGHGQLAWKLRQDPRVVVLEKTNARYLDASTIPEPIGALVCDASFIGLRTILPAPTWPGPASNCGLINATAKAPGAQSASGAGRMVRKPIKEASQTRAPIGSGMALASR